MSENIRFLQFENGEKYDRLIATRGDDYLLVYNHTGRDMPLNLTKISGEKKNVWWMNPTDGTLKYLGEYDNKTLTFRYDKRPTGIQDGVLIAVDSSKEYLAKDQTEIGTKPETVEKDRTE